MPETLFEFGENRMTKKKAIWNAEIVKRAILDSFRKLNPRKMMRNPVMFVVEVGSVLTTLHLIRGIIAPVSGVTDTGFELQITLWLWFTVLFANFAEAMA
jgi:potassium-transporting ATPase ATP-binding subunit